MADCLVHQGRLHRAFRQYERLFAAGDFPRAYLPFAELLVIRGDYERAQDYLALASVYLGRKPAAARAQYLLGQILLDQQQFAAAAGALEQSHQILPDDWRTLNLLAEAEAGAGRSEAAIKHYRQALQLAPQTGELHNRLGLLYLKTADYDLAKREFESAVAANPNDDAAAANLEVVKRLTP